MVIATESREMSGEMFDRSPSPLDRLRCRAVCRSLKEASLPEPRVPLLLEPARKGTHHLIRHPSPGRNPFRTTHLPPLGFVVGSCPGGWILHVGKDVVLRALNVFTGEQIDTPPIETSSMMLRVERDSRGHVTDFATTDPIFFPDRYERFFRHAVILFPERTETDRGRALIVASCGLFKCLAFAREGDERWSDLGTPDEVCFFEGILLYKGLVCAVQRDGPVYSWDLSESSGLQLLSDTFHSLSKSNKVRRKFDGYMTNGYIANYIVEIYGELWLVSRKSDDQRRNNGEKPSSEGRNIFRFLHATSKVALWKLDDERKAWIEVACLPEKVTLFLGNNMSLALHSSEFPADSIYFTDDWDSHESKNCARNVGLFNFKENTFRMDCHWCPNGNNFHPPTWILP